MVSIKSIVGINKKVVFATAWRLARNAAERHGGKPSQFFPECLKAAWSQYRQVDQIGLAWAGSEWSKHGIERIYFNDLAQHAGLNCQHDINGNISSASFQGRSISADSARKIGFEFDYSKFFWDINNQKFVFHNVPFEYQGDILVSVLTNSIESIFKRRHVCWLPK